MRLQQSCCKICNERIETGDKIVQVRTGTAGLPFWRLWFGVISPFRSGIGESIIHEICLDEELQDEVEWQDDYPETLAVKIAEILGGVF